MEKIKIIDTNAGNIHEFGMCGYKNMKQEGYRRKIQWIKQRFAEGMKYKILYADKHGAVGGIEYIPGEYAWRPVEASGYMFIHCIFIMLRQYKEKGFGALLVEECLKDAKKENMHGAAVVTRKGTWMAGKELFIKKGFDIVDKAPPDFELLVKKINKNASAPKFKRDWENRLEKYDKGLTIISSDQCPYSAKAVKEINETAKESYGIQPHVIELENCREARDNSPCAFGTFCMVYNGKLIAEHPISKTRFKNIMNKILK
ncbi:MAG: YoaP domain-containing protein [Candidatus Aminicenantes bacterium]|nr:MAG: YoaP domain-containing protein [Candidatus Aminicenantes bacterium]